MYILEGEGSCYSVGSQALGEGTTFHSLKIRQNQRSQSSHLEYITMVRR